MPISVTASESLRYLARSLNGPSDHAGAGRLLRRMAVCPAHSGAQLSVGADGSLLAQLDAAPGIGAATAQIHDIGAVVIRVGDREASDAEAQLIARRVERAMDDLRCGLRAAAGD